MSSPHPASPLRIVIELPGLLLCGTNELIRMHPKRYASYREELCHLIARTLPRDRRPHKPLRAYRLRVYMRRPTALDTDNKYGAIKPVLDVLQRMHPRNNPHGLDVLYDDTDGEFGLGGACRELRVVQTLGQPRLTIDIREVLS